MWRLGMGVVLGTALSFLSPQSAAAQAPAPTDESAIVLSRFLLLESARSERAHLDLAADTSGAVEYSGGMLPKRGAEGERMYTFRAAFSLGEGRRGQDLSLYVGLTEYPLRLYLNGTEILAKVAAFYKG